MLTEQRYEILLNNIEEKGSITVQGMMGILGASESTVRRDITALDKAGKLVKVFGGAIARENSFRTVDEQVEIREELNPKEKDKIGRYAASLIEPQDFVYIDAGTTTARMIDYITEKSAVFVTNAVEHGRRLARKGFQVHLIGGELKPSTEAIIGNAAMMNLRKYNFTVCFMATNGISRKKGFSTPDLGEAMVKQTAMEQSHKVYMLADHTKFGAVSPVSFARFEEAEILTDRIPDEEYKKCKNIKEVDEK